MRIILPVDAIDNFRHCIVEGYIKNGYLRTGTKFFQFWYFCGIDKEGEEKFTQAVGDEDIQHFNDDEGGDSQRVVKIYEKETDKDIEKDKDDEKEEEEQGGNRVTNLKFDFIF